MLRTLHAVRDELALERDAQTLLQSACQHIVERTAVLACASVRLDHGAVVAHVCSWPVAASGGSGADADLPACLWRAVRGGEHLPVKCSQARCAGCPAGAPDPSCTAHAVVWGDSQTPQGAMLFVLPDQSEEETAIEGELLHAFGQDLARQLQALDTDRRHALAVGELEREREELRAARDQLDAIIRAAPAAILSLDPHGLVTSWNPAAERMFGWTAAEVVGQPLPIVPPHKRNESAQLIKTVVTGASLMGVQVTRVRKDGTPIELSVSTAPIRGSDGRIRGVMAATLDITEERRTAERLRESQRKLETLMGNLQGMVYRCANDADWTMEFVSKGCVELTGYRPEQLLGANPQVTYASLMDEADAARVWDEVQAAVRDKRPFVMEYRIRDATGQEKWVWEQGSAVFATDGTLEALEGFIADQSRAKGAEEAARLGEARLASLFELTQKKASESELIEYALEEAVRLTGSKIGYFHLVEPDQITLHSHTWSKAVREACSVPSMQHSPLDVAGIWADCARYKCPIVHEDYQNLPGRKGLPDGHSPMVRHLGAPIVSDGLVVAVAGVANKDEPYDDADVRQLQLFLDGLWRLLRQKRAESQWAALEEQLRVSRKMDAIGRLASGIAHDFNNMVAAVTGYAEILLDDIPDAHPHHADLVEIRKAGERAGALTRQLLAFARKQVFVPEILSLNHVVADLEKMLRRLIGEDIDLVARIAPDLGLAELDRGQVEQVIMNLVLNARDAMPRGGRLTVETSNLELTDPQEAFAAGLPPGRFVALTVTDTGTGIDEATRERLFEPFFTTKPVGRGTGLGLATVYGIVTQSGGNIRVTSELGRGSTFLVLFPRAEPTSEPVLHAEPLPRATGTETVLVVEDEAGVLNLAQRILTSAGYQVLTASRGDDALAVCDQYAAPIHLLIADVVMPGLNSVDLAAEVARRKPGIRVLHMSAHTGDVLGRHGVSDDDPCFLAKPFTAVELTRRVRAVLDQEDTEPMEDVP